MGQLDPNRLKQDQKEQINSIFTGFISNTFESTLPKKSEPALGKASEKREFCEDVEQLQNQMYGNVQNVLDGFQEHLIEPTQARKHINFENIKKPQLLFKDQINNSSDKLFIPKISRKYNAKTPQQQGASADFVSEHPYSLEINTAEIPRDVVISFQKLSHSQTIFDVQRRDNVIEINTLQKLQVYI